MSDIVERLHDMDEPLREHERLEIAAEIERLRAALTEIYDAATYNTVLIPEKVAECARRALERSPEPRRHQPKQQP